MSQSQFIASETADFRKETFDIGNLQDEIRADQVCGQLLQLFARSLVEEKNLPPEQAGAQARGADYFLREFVIPDRRENIYDLRPERVRQFAGNWYIVKNLEPNIKELGQILEGIRSFYEFCLRSGKVSSELVEGVQKECAAVDYYQGRIEDFWAIEDDGYLSWEKKCSLKD
jgi:hypothetical protein